MKGVDRVQQIQLRTVSRSLSTVSLLAVFLLVGCVSQPRLSVEEQVGKRALEWVDAIRVLDYDKALTFMTPSYQSSPRADRFRGDFSGASFWQGAQVKWVKCDDDNSVPSDIGDAGGVASTGPADNAKAPNNATDCQVNVWDDCGKNLAKTTSTLSTVSTRSDRCEVRLILTVMKPPEMTYPMPIPYEMTWLNLDGDWYLYR
jgi:hypothetical protein